MSYVLINAHEATQPFAHIRLKRSFYFFYFFNQRYFFIHGQSWTLRLRRQW